MARFAGPPRLRLNRGSNRAASILSLFVDYRLTAPIGLDLQFEVRGFTALLGRSGAGKTSLLKALAGLRPATGTPWAGLPPEARPVGYMPQGSALFPHLTALGNAAFALRGPDRLAQARTLLDELGVGALAARPAATLSGGEAQRVALARALARQPQLLLLDEPAAALDGATRDAVLTWLIDSIAARSVPALAATHDPAIASLADWLVLLDGGRIIRQGPPRMLFADPQTAAAAGLLGYRNILALDGKTIAIHARDIEVVTAGTPGARAATITTRRAQSDGTRLTCAMPASVTVICPDEAAGAAGATIHLRFPPDQIRQLRD